MKIIFAERIKEIRLYKKLSQKSLAQILNLTQSTISLWENDKLLPSIETLVFISKKFDVPTDFLVGLTDYF